MPGTRIDQLVISGFLIAAANIYGSSLAAARFLSAQGGEGIATYYIVFALISVPAWAIYSRFIDSGSRALLLQRFLMAMIALTTLLTAASGTGGIVTDYALYAGISVLELLLFSLYMVMLTDYLTAREMSRFATRITVSLSAGSMAGGVLAGLLSNFAATFWLSFGMPLLLALCLVHLRWLSQRWPPAGEWQAMTEDATPGSLSSIVPILRGVPIAVLLAVAVFLNIATQCVSEFMVFSIYTDSFDDEQALASFFGLMSGALNLAAVLIGLGLTQPLMRRHGVARMNLVFPVSLTASFVAMMISPVLAVAMLAHIVYDGFSNNIDAPVMAVNYNAVPARFVGQLRVFNDSLIYPIALAASGAVLLVVDFYTGFLGVGLLGIGMGLAFVAVGWALGRNYVRGLIGILREGSVNLDQASVMAKESGKIVARHQAELRRMLAGEDPVAAGIALNIVAASDITPFIDAVIARLKQPDDTAATILARAGKQHAAALIAYLPTVENALRVNIMTTLAVVGHALPEEGGRSEVITALSLASRVTPSAREGLTHLCEMVASSESVAKALLPVAASRDDAVLVPVLVEIARHHPALAARALQALANFSQATGLAALIPEGLIAAAVSSSDADRRATGYRLAGLTGWPPADMVKGLSDSDAIVRRSAVEALKGRSDTLAELRLLLQSEKPQTRLAAIEALGNAGATDDLFRYLRERAFPGVASHQRWRTSIPDGGPVWMEIARIAMAEADQEAVAEVLSVLKALGHEQTVTYIRRFIDARDERMRARAAEAITALDERNLITPLLPLLGEGAAESAQHLAPAAIIAEMKTSSSPWLRRAAALATTTESAMSKAEEDLLSRLLFLRKVPIFESCSLDDLFAIHQLMSRSNFADGEVIIANGEQGEQFFILVEGVVRVGLRKATGFTAFARLTTGATFGEMALFGDGTRTADVMAEGPVSCLVLERVHFEDLVRQRPGILMQICRVFGSRLHAANRAGESPAEVVTAAPQR